MKYYIDLEPLSNEQHWFFIKNSLFTVILIIIVVIQILIKASANDLDDGLAEIRGWKHIYKDCFRRPKLLPLLTAFVSSGWHITLSIVFWIVVGMLNSADDISLYQISGYSFFGVIGGFQCGTLSSKFKEQKNKAIVILSAVLNPIVISILSLINLLSKKPASGLIPFLEAITSFEAITVSTVIYLVFFFLGVTLGKKYQSKCHPEAADFNLIQRSILKEKKFYSKPGFLISIGGFFPFSAIYIEVYFILSSISTQRIYYLNEFMLFSFITFAITSSCVSIISTYITINSEDYRWHWVGFLSSASASVYFVIYCVWHCLEELKIMGFLQLASFFGFVVVIGLLIGLVAGALGYSSSSLFVEKLSFSLKSE